MVVMREASSKKYSKQLRRQASTLNFSVYFPLNPHFSLTYTKNNPKENQNTKILELISKFAGLQHTISSAKRNPIRAAP
jgi:hypothetical protein